MLLLILLRLAMSENQRRLTRARFFEVPFTQKLRNAYISTKIIAMHSIECKLIEVKEAKTEMVPKNWTGS